MTILRKHYESLNYMDAAPGRNIFCFTRTNGADTGFLAKASNKANEMVMTKQEVESLCVMLQEVLEDWK